MMLDLITLFAGIGIGWIMGRTLAQPHRAQEGTQEATESPQIDQEGSTRGNGHTIAGKGHACSHPETETTLCGLTTCWTCGTEWTEAR